MATSVTELQRYLRNVCYTTGEELERSIGNLWFGSQGPLVLSLSNEDVASIWFSKFPEELQSPVERYSTLDLVGRLYQILSFCKRGRCLDADLVPIAQFDLGQVIGTSSHKAIDTAMRINDFVHIFKLGALTKEHLAKTMVSFWLLEFCNALTANLKFHLTSLFNFYWDQELPPRSPLVVGNSGQLWYGPTYRRFRQVVFRKKEPRRSSERIRREEIILNTLFQGFKKGLLPITDEEILGSLIDHSKILARHPDGQVDDLEECVERTAEEIFSAGGQKISNFWTPSRSACVESNYAAYGFLGHYLRVSYLAEDVGTCRLKLALSLDELVGYSDGFYGPEEVRTKFLFSERDSLLKEMMRKAVTNQKAPIAMPAVVREPNKARIITKGSFDTYLGLKPYQKFLWDALRKFPQFRLIGEPMSAEAMVPLLQYWKPGFVFESGDFKQSTDYLDMRLSRVAMNAAMRHATWIGQIICDRGIGCHSLDYSQWKLNEIKRSHREEAPHFYRSEVGTRLPDHVDMTNGQLMGSPVSFPILCLVNFALLRRSFEIFYQKRIPIHEIPVLINGDDILFTECRELCQIWRETCTRGGLIPSIGKSYSSPEFLQINSENYKIVYGAESVEAFGQTFNYARAVSVRKIPYVNFGLMLDRHKSEDLKTLTTDKCMINFHTQYRDLCLDLVPYLECHDDLERVTEIFEGRLRRTLNTFSRVLERNRPLEYGGLGLRFWKWDVNTFIDDWQFHLSRVWKISLLDWLGKPQISIKPYTSYKTLFVEQLDSDEVDYSTDLSVLERLGRKINFDLEEIVKQESFRAEAWKEKYGKYSLPCVRNYRFDDLDC